MGKQPTALLRLHSACTSVAHFLAGLEGCNADMILGQAACVGDNLLQRAAALVRALSERVYDALRVGQPDEEGGPWDRYAVGCWDGGSAFGWLQCRTDC